MEPCWMALGQAAGVAGRPVVVEAHVRAVLYLEAAHVADRPVVVDAPAPCLADVDARVVRAAREGVVHAAGHRM